MSLIIALKDKDRFVLGADKQGSCGNMKEHTGTKVWQVKGYPGIIMGGAGFARANQLMQYADNLLDWNKLINEGLDTEHIVKYVTEAIALKLNEAGVSISEDGDQVMIQNQFLIAAEDRCWCIWQDLSVSEINESWAIGSGAEVAIGSIETAKMYNEKNPYKIITNAIDIAAENTLFIDHDIEFVETAPMPNDQLLKLEALDPETAEIAKLEIKMKKEKEKAEKKALEKKKKAEEKAKKKAEENRAIIYKN